MSTITIAGGVYRERCSWPDWDMPFGSGGRAAAAVCGLVDDVKLVSYASDAAAGDFSHYARLYGFTFEIAKAGRQISFDYVHPMSIPVIRPSFGTIMQNPPLTIDGQTVLRFGMLDGTAVVKAGICVYDPQSAFAPEQFHANGSVAERLAVVGNAREIAALSGSDDKIAGARAILERSKAEVVVVKSGLDGAIVVTSDGDVSVPAFRTRSSFTIGSGDVFAAAFAAFWAVEKQDPHTAARNASLAVADYVEDRNLPIRPSAMLARSSRAPLKPDRDRVYLAGPFFTMAQRWLIDEGRRCLTEAGMKVFSPFHEIGPGPAHEVGPADIAALQECDAVFAVLDGLDSGTIFEIGYARAIGKPVVGFSQTVPEEDLKMIEGSGCTVVNDFVTAVLAVAARS